MIWMSWRQFRAQALVGVIAVAALAVYLVILGMQIRHGYSDNLDLCQKQGGGCASVMTEFQNVYKSRLYFLDAILVLIPALIGLFWGAPLVTRELEAGTHRLVWNQSITRRRWLAIKLLVVGLASMALAGAASLLLTWAASPFDLVAENRFTTLLFGARNIVPIAYAAFAFVLGTVVGIMVRRAVPAMALTFLVFVVIQVLVPNMVRPHLMTPVTTSQPMTAQVIKNLSFLGRHPTISGLKIPGAWVTSSSELLTSSGQPIDQNKYGECTSGAFDAAADCLGKLNLHVDITYQPIDRYWTFQWLESALFIGLSVLLVAFGMWRIKGRLT
ncbi:MAG TPA: ABC transporter permease subunit [Actinoplanes sp.]|jgi:ABC-type transport system involved in multi-copper enzyme maturation permease subunit|nr:ABC transporter permease subunit [Actinoplanes sp.]